MISTTTRRDFLKTAATLAAACTVTPRVFAPSDLYAFQAPSDRLRMGCIGVGSMGRGDLHGFRKLCEIVAICDVDSAYGINQTLKSMKDQKPDTYKEYQRILERTDIDVVSIVTPDHWHVKIAIEALQAGKHVFCQKPLTLTLEENILIRKACQKYGKVFQVGTQQRSQRNQFAKAVLMVRAGILGDIKNIVCNIGESPTSGEIPVADVPSSLDWDLWLGPAPYVDYRAERYDLGKGISALGKTRCHYEFRWWYEYSGGKFTDWGAHHIDCALWALNLQKKGTGPISFNGVNAEHPVEFKDGYPVVNNRYNTSNKFDILCTFENGLTMHVVSNSPDGNGILFEGTKGKIHVNRGRIKGKPVEELPADAFKEEDYTALYNGKKWEGHKDNFIRCIREGGTPVSDVESHVQAMHCCHLAAIAARLNKEIKWDPVAEKIVGDDLAASFFARENRKGFEKPKLD
ncbi:MAG: Gfo/Idh/MocA family oxidoreductase [Planctomycetia bacterium]|nr:Gfo/Idh/MocA family oxidoreductase [Planctomycetia bacterium]